jgi:hypothetical protein
MQPPPRKVRTQPGWCFGAWWGCLPRTRSGRRLRPLPLLARGFWFVTELPPAPGGGAAEARRLCCAGDPKTFPEFRVCVCACAPAWQCCPLPSAFSGRHRGAAGVVVGGGGGCRFAEPCVWLFSLHQVGALQSVVATPTPPSPFANVQGICFKPSVRFGLLFPRGCGKEVGIGTALPLQRKAIKDWRALPPLPPPPILAVPPARGQGSRGTSLRKARNPAMRGVARRSGFAWPGWEWRVPELWQLPCCAAPFPSVPRGRGCVLGS